MKNRRKDRMTSLREMSEDICPYGVQHNFYASKNDDNRIKAESKARGRKLFLRKNYQDIYNNFVINIVTDRCSFILPTLTPDNLFKTFKNK